MVAIATALIAAALGLGAFSSLMFSWQWVLGPPNAFVASVLFVGVVAAAIGFVAVVVRRTERVPIAFDMQWVFLLTAILVATYWIVGLAQRFPSGYTDAWIIWNDHARFFYRDGGTAWLRMFQPDREWFHPDYPFLLPGLISSMWTLVGAERGNVPAVVACSVSLLSISIVVTSTSALSKDLRGVYAGLVLLATPSFLQRSASQYADLPVGLYMLTTVVLLAFADAWRRVRTMLLVAAGLSAGMAAWTKNEGLLFVCVVLVVQTARLMRWRAGAIRRDPLLVAMVQEFRTTRRVHPVYWIGIAVFVARGYGVAPLAQTDSWRDFAHAVFAMMS